MKITTPPIYQSRRALARAVTDSLHNDSLKCFRRDLDKALEAADRITGQGHFMGRYWAERAIADLVAMGCSLRLVRLPDNAPLYQVEWTA